MKKLLLFLTFIICAFSTKAMSPDTLISCYFDAIPFTQFAGEISKKSQVKIFYKESWVEGIKVTIHADQISVKDALELSLSGTGLEVSVRNNQLVILPGEKLPESLPEYVVHNKSDTVENVYHPLTQSEERYLTGRKADVTQTIQIGRKGLAGNNSNVTIRGRVLEQQTGEPVIGATMYLEELKSGVATDQNGFLSIVIKPGSYTASFAYMGLETRKYLLLVLSNGEFSIEMNKSIIQMDEVVIYGDRQMNIRFKDPGLEKISAKTIKEIPMMLGERDILKVSEMLPGIVTVGEGSSGLNVRGGNFDQNAFYLNKIPIYNTSHLFGFFPAFNADIIKDFSIYKGHIPAQYGGRLSSVFNIIGRQGNRKRFTARGGISPMAANLTIEGPVKKDTSSLLISGRYLYSDWILREIKDPVINSSKAGFRDASLSWNYDFKKSQLSVFAYHSKDHFKLSDLSSYDYA
ncbi:MAG: carboxypeptidase-like regulatory domain-containing protein, partial [Bacteroidales bacterium]|nr:carboxypeptidase-like regulatory domain-containing protein [Bacteroidales bacterium]